MDKNRAFTITEVLISSTILVLALTSVLGVFVMTKWLYTFSLAQANLQRDATMIAEKIIIRNPIKEELGIYGLRSAKSFAIPITTPTGSEIDFVGTDGLTRKYFLSGKSIIYQSPTQSPNQIAIYTAPANVAITLLFSEPITRFDGEARLDHETVMVYVAVSQNLAGKTAAGSVLTYVNLRNIQR